MSFRSFNGFNGISTAIFHTHLVAREWLETCLIPIPRFGFVLLRKRIIFGKIWRFLEEKEEEMESWRGWNLKMDMSLLQIEDFTSWCICHLICIFGYVVASADFYASHVVMIDISLCFHSIQPKMYRHMEVWIPFYVSHHKVENF